jgi:hypothetical protein
MMIPTRWLIISFWVFIGGMLAWQAYTYEINSEKESAARPPPQHFFFDPSRDHKPGTGDPNLQVADVRQTGYSITDNPMAKNFAFNVVLTNKGNAKATNVQVCIRPYRGAKRGGARNGDGGLPQPIPDNDPLALQNQWVEAPDLGPNESCTVSATFMSHPGINPGSNPSPQIVFQTEKTNP